MIVVIPNPNIINTIKVSDSIVSFLFFMNTIPPKKESKHSTITNNFCKIPIIRMILN